MKDRRLRTVRNSNLKTLRMSRIAGLLVEDLFEREPLAILQHAAFKDDPREPEHKQCKKDDDHEDKADFQR